ncbi:hypothetical protein B0H11DRAFT_1976415 [Mycena galericulata]|nr:hypothetical protein B0H11DRAFT_1976415 [Mycena galericulata]
MVSSCTNNPRYSNCCVGAQEDRWRPLYAGHRRRFFRAYRCCTYRTFSVRSRALFAGWAHIGSPSRGLGAPPPARWNASPPKTSFMYALPPSLGEFLTQIGLLGIFLGRILAPLLVPHTAWSLLSEHPGCATPSFALLSHLTAPARFLSLRCPVPFTLLLPVLLAFTLLTLVRRRLALRFSSERPHAP